MAEHEKNGSRLTRRDIIQTGAAGLGAFAALGIARKGLAIPDCDTSPAQTEGPYWVDEMLNRSDIRTDPSTGVARPGLPLRMALNVSEYSTSGCTPVSGCYVDVWHCDAGGLYSDVSQNGTTGQRFLRGYQVTDSHGTARFITIFPGYYNGRTVHIHFRVRKFSGSSTTFNFVSQLYFDDQITTGILDRAAPYSSRPTRGTYNTNDNIYSSEMLMRLSDNGDHVLASHNIVINDTPGLVTMNGLEMDDHAREHLGDYGGGTPPIATC